jgi:2-keto-4-pentenoate hydratase/2-oxohepta-3-ene-1,7-dioic acid hydratase in catechol pathway
VRIATYRHAEQQQCGVVSADGIHPFPDGTTVLDLVREGLEQTLSTGHSAMTKTPILLDDVTLGVPLTPTSVRDFVAFEEHVEGVRRSIDGQPGVPDAWYDGPTFYFTNPHALLATGQAAAFPARSVTRDFELEVAVVVGGPEPAQSLTPEQARGHVFGYCIMNDWSARDLQSREMQVNLGPAKGKDFATTLGPWLVTADELEPHRTADGRLALWCTAEVNGVQVGTDSLANIGWTFEELIAYASRDSLVLPGDVLGSGTVGNGGCLAELWGRRGIQDPPPLADGDVVTLTVDGIGAVTNVVTSAPAAAQLPGPRRGDPAETRRRHS